MLWLATKYNVKHSCVLMEKNADRCDEYGFAVPSDCRYRESLIINQKPLLITFIRYFKNQMADILKEIRNNPINLLKEIEPPYFLIKAGLPKIHLENLTKINFLTQLESKYHHLLKTKFSKREIECLREFIKNKSAKQIGEKLFLSTRTIEYYMNNIKNKLSCHTKSELSEKLQKMKELDIFSEIFS